MYATTHIHRMFLIAGTTFVLSLGSSGAFASASDDGVRRVTVHYGELDVSRPAGAQVLYGRIQRAALEVCSESSGLFGEVRTQASSCYLNAVADAVAQVNSPQLLAVYRARMARLASR